VLEHSTCTQGASAPCDTSSGRPKLTHLPVHRSLSDTWATLYSNLSLEDGAGPVRVQLAMQAGSVEALYCHRLGVHAWSQRSFFHHVPPRSPLQCRRP
jgi:hypothetical protein